MVLAIIHVFVCLVDIFQFISFWSKDAAWSMSPLRTALTKLVFAWAVTEVAPLSYWSILIKVEPSTVIVMRNTQRSFQTSTIVKYSKGLIYIASVPTHSRAASAPPPWFSRTLGNSFRHVHITAVALWLPRGHLFGDLHDDHRDNLRSSTHLSCNDSALPDNSPVTQSPQPYPFLHISNARCMIAKSAWHQQVSKVTWACLRYNLKVDLEFSQVPN